MEMGITDNGFRKGLPLLNDRKTHCVITIVVYVCVTWLRYFV